MLPGLETVSPTGRAALPGEVTGFCPGKGQGAAGFTPSWGQWDRQVLIQSGFVAVDLNWCHLTPRLVFLTPAYSTKGSKSAFSWWCLSALLLFSCIRS